MEFIILVVASAILASLADFTRRPTLMLSFSIILLCVALMIRAVRY